MNYPSLQYLTVKPYTGCRFCPFNTRLHSTLTLVKVFNAYFILTFSIRLTLGLSLISLPVVTAFLDNSYLTYYLRQRLSHTTRVYLERSSNMNTIHEDRYVFDVHFARLLISHLTFTQGFNCFHRYPSHEPHVHYSFLMSKPYRSLYDMTDRSSP